jgi:hypothetical protein
MKQLRQGLFTLVHVYNHTQGHFLQNMNKRSTIYYTQAKKNHKLFILHLVHQVPVIQYKTSNIHYKYLLLLLGHNNSK